MYRVSMYATRCKGYLDILTAALGFLFEPNSTIASATELPALDPSFGLLAVLTLIGPMGGSLRSDLHFLHPRQLDEVIYAAVCLQIMALACQS
jgi:hypothetical protein